MENVVVAISPIYIDNVETDTATEGCIQNNGYHYNFTLRRKGG